MKSNKRETRFHSSEKPVAADPSPAEQTNAKYDIADKRTRLEYVERKKNRSQSISLSIFVIFVMIITVIIILRIMKNTEPQPQFMFIQEGVIQHNIIAEGLFIREEVVLNSPDNGYLKPLIQSGNRISFGQTAAVVMKDGSDEHLVTIRNYEKQISELQRELMLQGKGPGAGAVYDEANEDISVQLDIVRRDAMAGSVSGLASNKSSIEIAVQRRETRLLGIDFNDQRLSDLKSQKKLLEDKLEVVAGNISVEIPGVVSYHLDGLEEILTIDSSDKISISEYKDHLDHLKGDYTVGKYLIKDEPALKIITGIYQQIALVIPASQDGEFTEDSIHELSVPEKGVTITGCKVIRKLVQGDEVLVVFSTDRQLSRFADHRSIGISLSTRTTTGMRIPYSAIFEMSDNNKIGNIMIVVNGYARKIRINIIDHDSEYAIISSADEADSESIKNGYLVKNPDSVKEGDDLGT